MSRHETVSRSLRRQRHRPRLGARQIHSALRTQGLGQGHTVIHAPWTGGGPGCHLIGLTVEQLRPHLLAVGLIERELDRVQTLLSDPEFVVASFPLQRPAAPAVNPAPPPGRPCPYPVSPIPRVRARLGASALLSLPDH